jgi:hypothetical protein
MSSMLALMSQIYHCWSAESLKNCEFFFHQNNEKSTWTYNILRYQTFLWVRCFFAITLQMSYHIVWILTNILDCWVCKWTFLQLQLNSSLFLSKIKDWNKWIERWKSQLIQSWVRFRKECAFCSLLLKCCSMCHYNIITSLFAFHCWNQLHSFNIVCIISQLTLTFIFISNSYHFMCKATLHIQWLTNKIWHWSSMKNNVD